MRQLDRKTKVSEKVIDYMDRLAYPVSIKTLSEKLEQNGLFPNKTTLYRIIEKLKTKNHVTQITLRNGICYYEKKKPVHHHHFFCETCESIFCLDQCHIDQHHINLQGLLPNDRFQINSHEFNLYGLCKQCSGGKK